MTELTELEKAVAMDTALYDEIESLLPKDGVIDDTCSLINELMYLIKRREIRVIELSPGDPADASYQQGYNRGFNDALHGYEPAKFGEPHDNQ